MHNIKSSSAQDITEATFA